MKSFLIAIALCLFAFSTYAFEVQNNGASLGLSNKINCGTSVTCTKNIATGLTTVETSGTFAGSIAGDGTGSVVGFLSDQVAATATTITAAECGSTFVNAGAIQMELPEASTVLGCRLTFITGNASNFDVNPDDADQILVETNAVGDAIRNATLGNSIVIEAISASQWAPVGTIGTWADIN